MGGQASRPAPIRRSRTFRRQSPQTGRPARKTRGHRLALRERYYSAVMSATGLLYLAMLTVFGTDLVARAVLNP